MKTTAIILSAGQGKRMGGDRPKQYLDLAGRPLLYYAVKAFEDSLTDEIILVAGQDDLDWIREQIVKQYGFQKIAKIVPGGEERYDSVICGLNAISACDQNAESKVLIHDGARPFVTVELIDRIIQLLDEEVAVIAGMPVKDTIKILDEEGYICATTERSLTWMAQTPQAFRADLICQAYGQIRLADESVKKRITDDAMVFTECFPKKKIRMIEGGYRNIKITTPDDMASASAYL